MNECVAVATITVGKDVMNEREVLHRIRLLAELHVKAGDDIPADLLLRILNDYGRQDGTRR